MSLNPHNPKKKTYAKLNFVNALEQIVPNIYFEKDYDLSGMEINPASRVINSHLNVANNINSVVSISSVAASIYSSINTFSGITPFFIKQNTNFGEITPRDFDKKILQRLDTTFKNYETSSDMLSYVSSTLLSSMQLNYPVSALNALSSVETSASHEYLISNLSWLYFLNSSGIGGLDFNPSSIVSSLVVNKLYRGQSVTLADGIKGLSEYIFKNYNTCTPWHTLEIIPTEFISGTGIYTSGTQQLDKWKTWIDVVYSPSYFDREDTTVRTAFENFEDGGKIRAALKKDVSYAGPFYRLLNAFSFFATDIHSEIDEIETFYDIETCPDELLPRLADLIGWKLFGSEPLRWRLQLKNAVEIYKRAGTKQSIQFGIDSVLAKEVFDLSSNIYELWESYIPYLMYYAIATDSLTFSGFDSWTRQKAQLMNVLRYDRPGPGGYSTSSMDENIRLAVDTIMDFLTHKHPHLFSVGGQLFTEWLGVDKKAQPDQMGRHPRLHPEFTFYYRDREMPIPPWEEIPYYATADITEALIIDIIDQLVCFGVRKVHAIQVGDYIRANTLRAHDKYREGNTWLMFTSGMEVPPNWDHILQSISTKRDEYLSLWNGKSSHFKVIFDASTFDFTKDTLEGDSAYAIIESARVIDSYSPAHSIPDIRLRLSGTEDYTTSSVILPVINLDKSETFLAEREKRLTTFNQYWSSHPIGTSAMDRAFKNREVSGTNFVSYRRGMQERTYPCTSGTGTPFSRTHVDSIADSKVSTSASPIITNIPRNTFRRRDYKSLLPTEGLYDRRGHNMPVSWDASTLEHSLGYTLDEDPPSYVTKSLGFSPLGFVPSAQQYHPIADYRNIPGVYNICEDLNSTNTFSGVDSSNTYPCRGLSALGSDEKHTQYSVSSAYYVDRGSLPSILGIMHSLLQRKQYIEAAKLYEDVYFDELSKENVWRNPVISLMNSSLEASAWDPSGSYFYSNFAFGRELHKLYKDYTKLFLRHFLRPDSWDLDGPNIFGHSFNSIFANSKFNLIGLAGLPGFFASSIEAASSLNYGRVGGPFDPSAPVRVIHYTSAIHSPQDLGVSSWIEGAEFRNKHILSGIELIMTSGTSTQNYFSIFKLDGSFKRGDGDNYVINNPLIQTKAIDGLPRLRIGIKDYIHDAPVGSIGSNREQGFIATGDIIPADSMTTFDGDNLNIYPRSDNFLTPEHQFRVSLKCLSVDEDLMQLGVSKVGIWIHTDYEDGKFWNWMPGGGGWHQHDATGLTVNNVVSNLAHILSFENEFDIPPSGLCLESLDFTRDRRSRTDSIVKSFEEKHFENLGVTFNTENKDICLPSGYLKNHGLLNRMSQKYIFEFFMVPSHENRNKFALFDKINIQDLTNKKRTEIEVTGDSTGGHPFIKYCNTSSVPCSKYEIAEIFKFWNLISGDRSLLPLASRNAAISKFVLDVSGGSRLNYRTSPFWHSPQQQAQAGTLGFIQQILVREGYSE